jgi:DNA-directed RNA polymerase subunit D
MNVTKIEDDFSDPEKERLRFIIDGTEPAFANSLRRIILGYVPTLAIEEITMVENTSPLFDEYVAHRLGLIPLASEQLGLNNQEDCEVCEGIGCDACTVTLTLTQETDSNSEMMVYSQELISNNTFVYPVHDAIPIIKMGPDQRLILEAMARMGTGREHAKWQPTASLGYQYVPSIEIDPSVEEKELVAEVCPRAVFSYDKKNDALNLDNLLNCNLCMECVETVEGQGIKVEGDASKIMFMIEGTGAIRVEDIIIEASNIMQDMAENFIDSFNIALEAAENDPTSMRKVSTFERITFDK